MQVFIAAGAFGLFTLGISVLDAVHQGRRQLVDLQDSIETLHEDVRRLLGAQNFSGPKKPAWLLRPLLHRKVLQSPEAPPSPS